MLYFDKLKTWGFDQSERAQGPSYIINSDKTWVFDQSAGVHDLIYIINSHAISCARQIAQL